VKHEGRERRFEHGSTSAGLSRASPIVSSEAWELLLDRRQKPGLPSPHGQRSAGRCDAPPPRRRAGTPGGAGAGPGRPGCKAGGVHCLLGHNGTGKSTLIKVLSGAHRPDAGRITWFGDEVSFANPQAAVRAGIATVYQELDLVEGLSVADNVFLGAEPRRLGSPNVDRCARPRGRCRPGSGTARCPCSARSRSCRRRPHRSSAWPGRRPSTRGCSAWTFFIDRREGS
jgi:hypothetical protein